jgi:polyisoprenoid-binding protein YceI
MSSDSVRPRVKRILLVLAGLAVLAVAGGYAAFALTGEDAPPPPRLSPSATAGAPPASGSFEPAPSSFAGYRVEEDYLGVGVRAAVGRTGHVTGTVELAGDRVTAADLHVDMRTLESDQARRDQALATRAIETDRYPDARFTLDRPFALKGARATGTLKLHGVRAPIAVRVRGQRTEHGVELVGSAPIAFRDFRINPPSVAGLVTVRDHGLLEFRLLLAPA